MGCWSRAGSGGSPRESYEDGPLAAAVRCTHSPACTAAADGRSLGAGAGVWFACLLQLVGHLVLLLVCGSLAAVGGSLVGDAWVACCRYRVTWCCVWCECTDPRAKMVVTGQLGRSVPIFCRLDRFKCWQRCDKQLLSAATRCAHSSTL